VDLHVVFLCRKGLNPYRDDNFGADIKWQGLSLDFPHQFLDDSTEVPTNNAAARRLRGALDDLAPDATLIYGYAHRLQRAVLRWTQSHRTILIMLGDSELRSTRGRARRLLKRLYLPRLFRKVDCFLTVGDANEAYYRHYGVSDNKLVRCFFPIDIEHYSEAAAHTSVARMKIRCRLGIAPTTTVALTVGKLVSWKRQRDAVLAIRQLHNEGVDVSLVLAGTGPDEQALKALAGDLAGSAIHFAGFVQPQELTDYYNAADLYLHCSSHKPHSLAISEALYIGLPIIVSDKTGSHGPTDDVQPDHNGLVYATGDAAALASAVGRLHRDKARRECMGQRSAELGRLHQQLAHSTAIQAALANAGPAAGTTINVS
jgi:glycosyltransferase involved in cell wall biosynthesis